MIRMCDSCKHKNDSYMAYPCALCIYGRDRSDLWETCDIEVGSILKTAMGNYGVVTYYDGDYVYVLWQDGTAKQITRELAIKMNTGKINSNIMCDLDDILMILKARE